MLCQTMVLKHILDAQIFEYDSVSRVYKFPGYLMQELLSKVGYPLCDPGQLCLGFLPVIGTKLLAMQRFIGRTIFLLSLDIVFWIVEVLTIRSYGCMSDAKVYSYRYLGLLLGWILKLGRKYDIPCICLISLDRTGLILPTIGLCTKVLIVPEIFESVSREPFSLNPDWG